MSMSKLVRTLLVILTVVVATVAQAKRVQASDSGCTPDIGKKTPVILVHGFLGKPSEWVQMISIINTDVPNVYVETFDYSQYNKDWVDNPNIGPKLAERIACLARSSRQAGGLGKVIVVVHSMGGLATRFAATEAPNASEVARDLGIVITIGTPNTGSEWADLGAVGETEICTPDVTVGRPPKVPSNSPCAWDALYGMSYHSTQITDLSWLPSSVPLFAIAGDVTVTYSLFRLMIKQDTKGDLVVGKNGALKGAARGDAGGGQATIPCSISIAKLAYDAIFNQSGLPPCWHSALPHNQTVELATVNAIKKYLASIKFASYVGSWHVHGANLTINADRTGSEFWELGPCTQSLTETRMCRANASITFTINSDGSIVGKIEAIWYTQWGDPPESYAGTPAGAGYIQPGYSFSLKHVGSHLLSEAWLNNPEGEGNSWWCDSSYAGYECGQ